jgi:r-opsin
MFIFGLISLTGNGVVISVFLSTKNLRTPSNLLVVNLAFSDFLMMLVMAPPMIVNCIGETWVFGPLMCELYAMFGSLFGCASIWTMVMIAVDRYNIIVNGISARPMTTKTAFQRILGVWLMSAVWTIIPLFGWNRYVPEGNMTACGLDYLNKEWFSKSYIVVYAFFCYFMPLFIIIYSYYYIVQAVFEHEQQMREQAKKMNVQSLRSGDVQATSAECKLAKIALMTISLWFMAWTPYLIINFTGIFSVSKITPIATIWGSVFAKANAIYNPIVYGISHPKYRAALQKKYPSLSCASEPADNDEVVSRNSQHTTAIMEEKPTA